MPMRPMARAKRKRAPKPRPRKARPAPAITKPVRVPVKVPAFIIGHAGTARHVPGVPRYGAMVYDPVLVIYG